MTNRDRILSVLTTAQICDDCLTNQSSVHPRQSVYQICTALSDQSLIMRYKGACMFCSKEKLVSRLYQEVIESGKTQPNEPNVTSPWYWEGNVQATVADYLTQNGHMIHSVADTLSRERGKDIIATTPEGDELWVTVKGYPEKSSNTQARHWFSQALFDLVLYRGENPNVKLALALPDSFVTYQNLIPKIGWLKDTMPFDVFWVSEGGNVHRV